MILLHEPIRKTEFDFDGESYNSLYPNLHRYPATMLPQIGVRLLQEFDIKEGTFLDPYCGSGSSFSSALEVGNFDLYGYDLNPLAILISKAKFSLLDLKEVDLLYEKLKNELLNPQSDEALKLPEITNIDYWYAKNVQQDLAFLRSMIFKVVYEPILNLFLVPFCETVRDCSYTRANEFKLFRIPEHKMANFQPDAVPYYLLKLKKVIDIYRHVYYPKLQNRNYHIELNKGMFEDGVAEVDVVLTSPPYGDSRTTVAYGQFSTFANEWLEEGKARQLDTQLMGGKTAQKIFDNGVIAPYIHAVAEVCPKRAKEVSSFYFDLQSSIRNVAKSLKTGGYAIYVLGNRTIKNVQLRTDLFVAEQFTQNGCAHLATYARKLSNKVMPSANSPSNINGQTAPTMTMEYIVICRKTQ